LKRPEEKKIGCKIKGSLLSLKGEEAFDQSKEDKEGNKRGETLDYLSNDSVI